jgi:hypothetical protein
MGSLIVLVASWVFLIMDCIYYARHHEQFEAPGWKKFLIAITPGSGFYYKWLSEQKETL